MKDKKELLTLPEVFPHNDTEEQETIIGFMRGDEYISIYTSDNTMLTKLKKLVAAGPDQYKVEEIGYIDGDPCSVKLTAPVRCLSLRTGNKKEISEEERQMLAERMRNIAASRK